MAIFPQRLRPQSRQERGAEAEAQALAYLQARGLRLLARNYRVPRRGGGEIDLIMRDPKENTVVFVEVRARASRSHGGAAASIDVAKRRKLWAAAQHYLLAWPRQPAMRFDVVSVEDQDVQWLVGALDADGR